MPHPRRSLSSLVSPLSARLVALRAITETQEPTTLCNEGWHADGPGILAINKRTRIKELCEGDVSSFLLKFDLVYFC